MSFFRLGALFTITLCMCVCLPACSKKRRLPQSVRAVKNDGAPKQIPKNLSRIPNAKPKIEPLSRWGNRYGKSNSYVIFNKRYHVRSTSRGYKERGFASWYGTQFHGRKTSNGDKYDMFAMTAAHKTLPLPTYVKVTNLKNNKRIIVKVNDRGPFHQNRIIDLSYAAALKLGMLGQGTAKVEVESVDPRDNGWKKKTTSKSKTSSKKVNATPTKVKANTTKVKKSTAKLKSVKKVKTNTIKINKKSTRLKTTPQVKKAPTQLKTKKTTPSKNNRVKKSTAKIKSVKKIKTNTTKVHQKSTRLKTTPKVKKATVRVVKR